MTEENPSTENHTIHLLTEMRSEMRDGFARVDTRLSEAQTERDKLRQGLEEARSERSELRQRMTQSETRLATELLAVSGAIQETKGLLLQMASVRLVVRDHESRLRNLEGE